MSFDLKLIIDPDNGQVFIPVAAFLAIDSYIILQGAAGNKI